MAKREGVDRWMFCTTLLLVALTLPLSLIFGVILWRFRRKHARELFLGLILLVVATLAVMHRWGGDTASLFTPGVLHSKTPPTFTTGPLSPFVAGAPWLHLSQWDDRSCYFT